MGPVSTDSLPSIAKASPSVALAVLLAACSSVAPQPDHAPVTAAPTAEPTPTTLNTSGPSPWTSPSMTIPSPTPGESITATFPPETQAPTPEPVPTGTPPSDTPAPPTAPATPDQPSPPPTEAPTPIPAIDTVTANLQSLLDMKASDVTPVAFGTVKAAELDLWNNPDYKGELHTVSGYSKQDVIIAINQMRDGIRGDSGGLKIIGRETQVAVSIVDYERLRLVVKNPALQTAIDNAILLIFGYGVTQIVPSRPVYAENQIKSQIVGSAQQDLGITLTP